MRRLLSGAAAIVIVTIATAPAFAHEEMDAGVAEGDAGTPELTPNAGPEPEGEAGTEPPPADTEIPTGQGYETVVEYRAPLSAASADRVRARDFLLRPHGRPADILMVTPGLFIFQHAGGGKANQYFLRGFDIDHGTDLALSVDGVPVNMLSHGHGQGYADLHFVIPELISRVDLQKGPYDARNGDLATAGAINMVTRKDVELSSAMLSGGRFHTARALLIASPRAGDTVGLVAAELYRTDGPFQRPEELRRFNLFGKVTHPLSSRSEISATFMTYGGGWYGSGQLPSREVDAGRLDRFGFTELFEGGSSARSSAQVRYRVQGEDGGEITLMAYALRYRLRLYSNFTLYSRDPVNGDEIEQNDVRTVEGLEAVYHRHGALGGLTFDTTAGFQLRADSIDTGLHHDVARERLTALVDSHTEETGIGVWASEEITVNDHLRAVLGARLDYLGVDVTDRLEDLTGTGDPTSGVRKATIVSPKASLIATPWPGRLDLFANFGSGFHSNDARSLVRRGEARGTPFARALGYELGARASIGDRVDVAGAAFLLDLDSEVVWIGDDGTTEASGETRRYGVELEARAALLSWLYADVDLTATRAAFRGNAGNGGAVALAPRLTISGGLSARHESGLYGRLGAVHIGDRPATEDEFLTAEGFTKLDLSLGYRRGRWEASLTVENLTNTAWREAQFATVSRLPNETSPSDCPAGTRGVVADDGRFEGCEDVNFTPGAPINLQLAVMAYF